LAGLYEAGETLPPIKVVPIADGMYAYVDGRHRGAALAYLGLETVNASILPMSLMESPAELYAQALESNWGGAKPPSRNDITHTVTRMMECGATQGSISQLLGFLPKGALRAYIAAARSTIVKRKVAKSLEDIAGGYTLEEAAKRQRVSPDTLRSRLSGSKRKLGLNSDQETIIALNAHVARELGHANKSISKKVQYMLQQVEDGEVSTGAAKSVIKAWQEKLRRSQIYAEDWLNRLAEKERGALLAGATDVDKETAIQ
jgi:hypothetical protein